MNFILFIALSILVADVIIRRLAMIKRVFGKAKNAARIAKDSMRDDSSAEDTASPVSVDQNNV